jgi:hypothetical protein
MDEAKKQALLKEWEDFHNSLPPEMVIRKGGLNGEDIVLKKRFINGVPMYSAPLEVPCWGAKGGE